MESTDAYVLPAAQQIFLWIGRKVAKDARPKAWDIATVRSLARVHARRASGPPWHA